MMHGVFDDRCIKKRVIRLCLLFIQFDRSTVRPRPVDDVLRPPPRNDRTVNPRVPSVVMLCVVR